MVGLVALAYAGMAVFSILTAAAAGCRLVFTQAEMAARDPLGEDTSCWQYVDLVTPLIAAMFGVALLLTARRLGAHPASWTWTVAAGVTVGLAVSLVPAVFLAQLASYYRYTLSPVELGIGAILPVWAFGGLLSAWRRWQAARSAPRAYQ